MGKIGKKKWAENRERVGERKREKVGVKSYTEEKDHRTKEIDIEICRKYRLKRRV